MALKLDKFPSGLNRRTFLYQGALVMLAAESGEIARSLAAGSEENRDERISVRVGLLTDSHYADKDPAGSRYYRQTLDKLSEAVGHFKKQSPDFVVELGDFIDAAQTPEIELEYLDAVDAVFRDACEKRHYVLGNHCVDTLTKEEFLGKVGQERSYYSFDQNGVHFIVLDSCFRSDGKPYGRKNFQWTDPNIPKNELEWLRADLKNADQPTIVFAHQRLDVENNYGVNNAPQVRKTLEQSGKVTAVFQGHSHKNDYRSINGIHYCTLAAMVEGSGAENSGYSILEILKDGSVFVRGSRKQDDYAWAR